VCIYFFHRDDVVWEKRHEDAIHDRGMLHGVLYVAVVKLDIILAQIWTRSMEGVALAELWATSA
jgi:hypothetical protein